MFQFFSKFLYVLQGRRKKLIPLAGLFLFISLLEAFSTGMIGPFIAVATNPDSASDTPWLYFVYQKLNLSSTNQIIWILGAFIILLFYLKAFLNFYANRYIFRFGYDQQRKLSSKLMHDYLAAPYTFHLTNNSAVLIQNIVNETDRFANNLMMPLLTSFANIVIVIALVTLLIKTDLKATIVIFGILLIATVLYLNLKDKFSHWGKEISDSRTEMIRVINHGLGGFKEARIIGCESYFETQLEKQTKRYANSISLALNFSTLPRFMIEAFLITFLVVFSFIFITTSQGKSENLSSVLGVFAVASIRLLPAASNLVNCINTIKYNSYSLDKLYLDFKELEELPKELMRRNINRQSTSLVDDGQTFTFQNCVSLEHMIYRYPGAEKNTLESISLEIQKGQSIGLVGKSGAGKTTLVDVILGLLTPQSGDIRVDGQSIYADLRSWHNMLGYVPQSIFLTDDTLERNIAFGVPDHLIDRNQLHKAIHLAQLSELVDQLPNGIKTMVGERGVLLSGGQRQRVGIARVLYHEREILIFDEATAALDNETENLVTEAIKSLSGLKTMIIIAHRLSTIEHCDRIYMLEQGQVVKSGSYEDVFLNKSTLSCPKQ
jgi:ABC-type multidrug transport system fused ATPase/permease subunit